MSLDRKVYLVRHINNDVIGVFSNIKLAYNKAIETAEFSKRFGYYLSLRPCTPEYKIKKPTYKNIIKELKNSILVVIYSSDKTQVIIEKFYLNN